MNGKTREVSTASELQAAAANSEVQQIIVSAAIAEMPTLRLSPGQMLTGAANGRPALRFAEGTDGVKLSADNQVEGLMLIADRDKRALFNDTSVEQLGRLVLHDLTVEGVVQLLARDQVRSGHVEAHSIDIVAADARGYQDRPKGYGVEVIPGAFTLWNQHADRAVTITADLTGADRRPRRCAGLRKWRIRQRRRRQRRSADRPTGRDWSHP